MTTEVILTVYFEKEIDLRHILLFTLYDATVVPLTKIKELQLLFKAV